MCLAGLPAALLRLREDPRSPARNTTSAGRGPDPQEHWDLLAPSPGLVSKLLITPSNRRPVTLRSRSRRAVIACHDVLPARMVDRIVAGNIRIGALYPIYPIVGNVACVCTTRFGWTVSARRGSPASCRRARCLGGNLDGRKRLKSARLGRRGGGSGPAGRAPADQACPDHRRARECRASRISSLLRP